MCDILFKKHARYWFFHSVFIVSQELIGSNNFQIITAIIYFIVWFLIRCPDAKEDVFFCVLLWFITVVY